SWSTMALMVLFRSNISPRTSADTFLLRSPSATAPMTRCISLVGRTRSSIRLLTESMGPDQRRVNPPRSIRCDSFPCLPTTSLTRASSAQNASLTMLISLKPSATLPARPIQWSGNRAVKSPALTWARKLNKALASTVSSPASAVAVIAASMWARRGPTPPKRGRSGTRVVLFDGGSPTIQPNFRRRWNSAAGERLHDGELVALRDARLRVAYRVLVDEHLHVGADPVLL